MSGVDTELERLAAAVATGLTADGWVRRELDRGLLAIFTRQLPNGILAVAELARTSFGFPDRFPVTVTVHTGVGFDAALNLMPVLALPVWPIIIPGPPGHPTRITVERADAIPSVGEQILRLIGDQAAFASQFADPAAIEAGLTSPPTEDRDAPDSHDADIADARDLIIVAAARGNVAQVRALLAAYPPHTEPADVDREDRRFIRQVTRWLEAGGPVPPPVEATLAILPRSPTPSSPSWSATRASQRARLAADAAVRASAKGKSIEELQTMLAAEYVRRGLDAQPPSELRLRAEMMHLAQQPFGRARAALVAIRAVTSAGKSITQRVRSGGGDDPEWLEPPDRASYPVQHRFRRYVPVATDPAHAAWINRVFAEAPRRVASWVLVTAWLRADGDAPLEVFIGDQAIGVLDRTDAASFASILRAAAFYDEDPQVQARICRFGDDPVPLVEVAAPSTDVGESSSE